MQTNDIVIISEQGLHAKPADLFVRAANKYICDIRIMNLTKNSRFENAKSILKVLSLGIYKTHHVRIKTDGIDEAQAISELSYLISNDFRKEIVKKKKFL